MKIKYFVAGMISLIVFGLLLPQPIQALFVYTSLKSFFDPFVIECESDWELVETFFIGLVNEYLSSGKYAGKLKEYQAIGIGFVDGDLHILYAR